MPGAAFANGLNTFQLALEGTWTNQPLPGARHGEGGRDNPLAYNVMPLPQASAPQGYILKNCTVFETLRFISAGGMDGQAVAVPTTAPNRSSDSLQLPTAPYEAATIVEPNRQPPAVTIAKQMSVPHGNSILALGHVDAPAAGPPRIADSASVLPTPAGLGTERYTTVRADMADFENPLPAWTANPNLPLQLAVGGAKSPAILTVTSHVHWSVTTHPLDGGQGATMNIPFEQRRARVSAYSADYWLLSTDARSPDEASYPYLAYSQVITLDILIGNEVYAFPHVTTNLVTRQP